MLRIRTGLFAVCLAGLVVLEFAPRVGAEFITDPWDVNQGGTILSSSGAGKGDLRNMFGGLFESPEPGVAFFRDDQPTGFTHFVEFQSIAPFELLGYDLYVGDDHALNPGDRGFTEFRLFALNSATSSFQLLDTFIPASHPFGVMTVSRTLTPVLAQRFRAEFDQYAPDSFPGPRVFELDALTVPEPSSLALTSIATVAFAGVCFRRSRST